MNCLIIAAGQGKRLSSMGDSKPLVKMLGLPLIERVILTAVRCGIKDFYVVTGYSGKKVRRYLERIEDKRNINITCIENDEWKKENGISVLKAEETLHDNFILLMGDHIFDESILKRLIGQEISGDEVILAVDRNVKTNTLVDEEDVTKVMVKDGLIYDIGKEIKDYNGYDTGVFLCSPAIFGAIEESTRAGDSSLSGGIRVLAQKGKARTIDVQNAFWIDVDDEKSYRKGENRLIERLKKQTDGPVSRYINRPISLMITRLLTRTPITPNQVSFLSFIIAIFSALLFSLGGYINLVTGGVLAQISSIVDGCDGEIARLKYQESDFGGWFDSVLDRYADAFLLAGLTMHDYSLEGSTLSLVIGFFAITGSLINSYMADKYDGLMKKRLGATGRYFRIGRDIRIFVIFIGAVINQPFLVILTVALVMNIENIRRVVLLYRHG